MADPPYKAAFTPDAALGELRNEVRKGWKDGALVDAFQNVMTRIPAVHIGHISAASFSGVLYSARRWAARNQPAASSRSVLPRDGACDSNEDCQARSLGRGVVVGEHPRTPGGARIGGKRAGDADPTGIPDLSASLMTCTNA